MPTLFVAIYRPRDGNVHHWSLYLQDSVDGDMIYEVTGSPGDFKHNIISGVQPEKSKRHVRSLEVAEIDRQDINAAKEILANIAIKDVATWSCQDFVLEGLEELHDEAIIGDYQYAEAKDNLEAVYDE